MQYTGTPSALSSATPGFLGQATASGGFYTFDPSLILLPGTQYFFYENGFLPSGAITGGNVYAGGQAYYSGSADSNFVPDFGDGQELGVRSSHLTLAVKACSVLAWPGHCGLNLGARFII